VLSGYSKWLVFADAKPGQVPCRFELSAAAICYVIFQLAIFDIFLSISLSSPNL